MGTSLNVSQDLTLDLEDIIGRCISILGIRGSGKSNTAGVLFEELLQKNYPLSIIDIDGEYFGLKEKFEVLVVGRGESAEIDIDVDCAEEIASISLEKSVPVVLDLSEFLSDERDEILKEYLTAIWNLAGELRRPYIIGIEEAHEFIPQGVKGELKEMVSRIALRGRKRGLGAIIISQRSAKVEKDVLSQAGILFLHRVVHEVDMRVYDQLLPWKKREVKEIINSLETGDCVYVNGDEVLPVYVRERNTFHAGFTPSLKVVETPQLKQVSQSIIEAIEKAKDGRGKRSQLSCLQEQVNKLEELIEKKDDKIEQLEDIARTLGYLKVEVPSPTYPDKQDISKAVVHSVEGLSMRSKDRETSAISRQPDSPSEICYEDWKKLVSEESVIDIDVADPPHELPQAVLKHIERVITRIERKNLVERRLLAFVIGHASTSYSVEQISAWTNCAEAVIVDSPPRASLEMGMIVRERRSNGVHYRSNLRAFVNREFQVYCPDITKRDMHWITQLLRAGIVSLIEEPITT